MTDFSHMKQKTEATARFIFTSLEGEPSVVVARADTSNKKYLNAMLKGQSRNRRRSRKVTAELIDRMRREDQSLFAHHIIKSWDGVLDSKGKPVPFSPEVCEEFLEAIEPWMFDELRDFASDPQSFLSEDEEDAEETAKN